MNIIDKIRDLISQDKTDYVIRELLELNLDAEIKNSIILLSGQWKAAKQDYNIGIVSSKDWYLAKNRINHSLLQILAQINEDSDINEIENRIDKVTKNNTITVSGNNNMVFQDANNSRIFINSNKTSNKDKQILLIINSLPKGKQPLSVSEEIRVIENALYASTYSDKIELITKNAVRFDELIKIIHSVKPTYLHFSLHNSKNHGLIFENHSGSTQYIDKNSFTDIFKLISEYSELKLVLINSCNSSDYATAIIKYVKYAIGMKDFIPNVAALAFTKGFYEMLFDGEDVEFSFKAGVIALKLSKIEFNSTIPVDEIPVLVNQLNSLI